MEAIFLFLIVLAVIFFVWRAQANSPAKEKAKREFELVARTNRLYEQAREITPFTADSFVGFVTEKIGHPDLCIVAARLYALEGFAEPAPPPPIVTGIDGGRYRDYLTAYINSYSDETRPLRFSGTVLEILKSLDTSWSDEGLFKAKRYKSNKEIEELILPFLREEQFFETLRAHLTTNIMEQKGQLPSQYKGNNCPWAYLKDTPLLDLEYDYVDVQWLNRASHTLILGGTGSGKTTLVKHMVARLLEEDCCVIVMDSQSQVIEELAHLKLGEDELTWISPEHKLALNPFDVDPEDLKDETVINNKISLLEFVVENLIEAPMTPRQKNLFYFSTQLVLSIPDGNVATFKEVLKDPYEFAPFIDELDETARRFFNDELRSSSTRGRKSGSYDGTREELSYRLDGLTKQPTFRRILQTDENMFDFYEEMQDRKLILLDTSQALLADDSATLGRFLIANALQACFQRVKNKETERPVNFFVDEAHEYFDEKLEKMLLQARKANVGMILATQDFGRATKAGITDTLLGSTSTQIISQVTMNDARRLAPRMRCDPEFLTDLVKPTFAFASGGESVAIIEAQKDPLAGADRIDDLTELRKDMEYHYGPEVEENDTSDTRQLDRDRTISDDETPTESAMSENEDHDIKPSDTL